MPAERPLLSTKVDLVEVHRIAPRKLNRLIREGHLEPAADYFPPGKAGIELYPTDRAIWLSETPWSDTCR